MVKPAAGTTSSLYTAWRGTWPSVRPEAGREMRESSWIGTGAFVSEGRERAKGAWIRLIMCKATNYKHHRGWNLYGVSGCIYYASHTYSPDTQSEHEGEDLTVVVLHSDLSWQGNRHIYLRRKSSPSTRHGAGSTANVRLNESKYASVKPNNSLIEGARDSENAGGGNSGG